MHRGKMSSTTESKDAVRRFWAAMETNDFGEAAKMLADDYFLEWPQSGERVRGPANFIAVNEHYPVDGRWAFSVRAIVAEGDQAVSDVEVSDQSIKVRVITFSTVDDGKIVKQVEFWPDPFEPASWRSDWVERI